MSWQNNCTCLASRDFTYACKEVLLRLWALANFMLLLMNLQTRITMSVDPCLDLPSSRWHVFCACLVPFDSCVHAKGFIWTSTIALTIVVSATNDQPQTIYLERRFLPQPPLKQVSGLLYHHTCYLPCTGETQSSNQSGLLSTCLVPGGLCMPANKFTEFTCRHPTSSTEGCL